MGGYGSTRWTYHTKAETTDACHALDVRLLARDGALKPWNSGTVTWSRRKRQIAAIGYAVRPTAESDLTLVLNYRITRGDAATADEIEIPITLETTPLHLGGVRWWARCPMAPNNRPCKRRIAILYLPPGERCFGCRHCHRLTYESVQTHDKRVDWLRRHPEALHAIIYQRGTVTNAALFLAIKALSRDDYNSPDTEPEQ